MIKAKPTAKVLWNKPVNVSLKLNPIMAVAIEPKIMKIDSFPYSDLKSNVKNAFIVFSMSFQKISTITTRLPRCKRIS